MSPHPLTNLEIMKYYENESKFNGVHSRDGYSDSGTHWIALYVKNNVITYFDSFGVEHIPKEIKAFINEMLRQIFSGYRHTIQ